MKSLLLLSIFCISITLCFGQTQLEINENAGMEYRKADKELNQVYQAILKNYKNDLEFIKNIKIAQRIWIQFRDAEMKVKYPDRTVGYYGSIHSMCWSNYMQELTVERISKLRIWLTPVSEGDSCAGSIEKRD